ncbi:MAG: hypothetical protein K8T25_06690 [Planctomycetia bacterium]|nr:hypothetical protein [Planctomycetia bacterium]
MEKTLQLLTGPVPEDRAAWLKQVAAVVAYNRRRTLDLMMQTVTLLDESRRRHQSTLDNFNRSSGDEAAACVAAEFITQCSEVAQAVQVHHDALTASNALLTTGAQRYRQEGVDYDPTKPVDVQPAPLPATEPVEELDQATVTH